MKVGTIVKLRVECLGNKPGTPGVVFNDYGDGSQVIFENGEYDGFAEVNGVERFKGKTEKDFFLEEVGFAGYLAGYQFENVMQVSEDYRRGIFNKALVQEEPEEIKIVRQAFKEGLKAGVRRFAWWRDGLQYVGTCGTTLKKALEDIDKEFPDEAKVSTILAMIAQMKVSSDAILQQMGIRQGVKFIVVYIGTDGKERYTQAFISRMGAELAQLMMPFESKIIEVDVN